MIEIQDPETGQVYEIEGDTIPSADKLKTIYAALRGSAVAPAQKSVVPQNKNILQQTAETVAPISNFLMPNVVKYAQGALQEVGAGNLTPGAIGNQTRVLQQPTQSQQGIDYLMSILGPGAQQANALAYKFAGRGLGSEKELQKNAGVGEMYATAQAAKMLAGGVQGALSSAGETVQNIAGAKSLNPWAVTRYGREKAMQEAGKLDTTSLIKKADEYVSKNPYAKEAWETFKPTITDKMDATDLVGRMSDIFGKAYNRSGTVRDTAEAELLDQLYKAGRSVITEQAPRVAKYTKTFRDLYNAPKDIQKLSWLALKTTAIGKMLFGN